MEELLQRIIDELTIELGERPGFDARVLELRVKNACREVKKARGYQSVSHYTEDMIAEDIANYESNIRNIALFDVSQQVGAEFNSSLSENGIYRTFRDRDKLFAGIIPLAKCN